MYQMVGVLLFSKTTYNSSSVAMWTDWIEQGHRGLQTWKQ
jgi:hypothetical protein